VSASYGEFAGVDFPRTMRSRLSLLRLFLDEAAIRAHSIRVTDGKEDAEISSTPPEMSEVVG
jgi:hypothetical protein